MATQYILLEWYEEGCEPIVQVIDLDDDAFDWDQLQYDLADWPSPTTSVRATELDRLTALIKYNKC